METCTFESHSRCLPSAAILTDVEQGALELKAREHPMNDFFKVRMHGARERYLRLDARRIRTDYKHPLAEGKRFIRWKLIPERGNPRYANGPGD